MAENIIERKIEDEMRESYLNYAMSVIISRALPDVRDGLKPVHRRILYAMYKLGLSYNKSFRKSATVVGEVLGKYHPHGDMAIYDTLVRLAQDFSMNKVLIKGQGNFGSIDGDAPAAMRYTECKLEKISEELLKDIEKSTVDFRNNFDDSLKEPVVLPSAIPNLLINGSSGIAVGMATNIPPHNLREVIDAVCFFIDNQDCSISDLTKYIKGPDFPTGAFAYNLGNVKQAYETGKGIFKLRAKTEIEEFRNSQEAIIIKEIPYQVNKAEMIKKMAQLVKNETIEGISEIRDESNKSGIRVVIELKRKTNANIILNQLFKHTPLESSFGINMLAIVGGQPRVLNLREMIFHFVEHRFNVTTKRIKHDLEEAEKRAHILEGLIKAVDNIDEVIKIIRSSQTVDAAKSSLIKRFSFSEIQAQAILDMRLARLVALEIKKLQEELAELLKTIAYYKDLLSHKEKIYALIKDELKAISKEFGTERKTILVNSNVEEINEEQLIQKSNMVISVSKTGYIKRTPDDVYRQQNRGGQGVKAVGGADEIISNLFVATTHDIIMLFTNKGKAYYLKAYEIPETGRTAKGTHLKMLLNLEANENIEGVLVFPDFEKATQFVIITQEGVGKRCNIKDFINAKKRGIQAIGLRDEDSVVGIVEATDGDDVMICSRFGKALRAKVSAFRTMGRTATGVRALKLSSGDEVIGVEKVSPDKTLLVVTEKGIGKRTRFDDFMPHGRGTGGQTYLNIDEEKTGSVAGVAAVHENDGVFIITSSGSIIRLLAKDISTYGRTAGGVRLVNITKPNFVVDIDKITEIDP